MKRLLGVLLLTACEPRVDVGVFVQAPGQLRVLDAGGPNGDTGLWPSVALGPDESRHVAYCDRTHGDVYYATHRGQQWKSAAVVTEGAVGKYATLAVDARGIPWIAYYDQDRGELRVAHPRHDNAWQTESVAWGLEVGAGAGLRFDANDAPELFFYAPEGAFRRGRRDHNGAWHTDVVSSATFGPGTQAGVLSTPAGPWLAFVDWDFRTKELVLAEPLGQSFALTRLPLGRDAGFSAGVFVDAKEPRVLYVRRGALHLVRRERDKWQSERLMDEVGAFAVAQSDTGELSVAVQDLSQKTSRLVLLRRTLLGGWQRSIIDAEGPVADHLSVALDTKGKTTLVYHAPAIRGVKLYDE